MADSAKESALDFWGSDDNDTTVAESKSEIEKVENDSSTHEVESTFDDSHTWRGRGRRGRKGSRWTPAILQSSFARESFGESGTPAAPYGDYREFIRPDYDADGLGQTVSVGPLDQSDSGPEEDDRVLMEEYADETSVFSTSIKKRGEGSDSMRSSDQEEQIPKTFLEKLHSDHYKHDQLEISQENMKAQRIRLDERARIELGYPPYPAMLDPDRLRRLKKLKKVLKNTPDQKPFTDRCYLCNRVGHITRDCNESEGRCYRCNKLGHLARDCAEAAAKYEDARADRCYRCNRVGHIARDCEEMEGRCYRCNKSGHLARDCTVAGTQYEDARPGLIHHHTVSYPFPTNLSSGDILSSGDSAQNFSSPGIPNDPRPGEAKDSFPYTPASYQTWATSYPRQQFEGQQSWDNVILPPGSSEYYNQWVQQYNNEFFSAQANSSTGSSDPHPRLTASDLVRKSYFGAFSGDTFKIPEEISSVAQQRPSASATARMTPSDAIRRSYFASFSGEPQTAVTADLSSDPIKQLTPSDAARRSYFSAFSSGSSGASSSNPTAVVKRKRPSRFDQPAVPVTAGGVSAAGGSDAASKSKKHSSGNRNLIEISDGRGNKKNSKNVENSFDSSGASGASWGDDSNSFGQCPTADGSSYSMGGQWSSMLSSTNNSAQQSAMAGYSMSSYNMGANPANDYVQPSGFVAEGSLSAQKQMIQQQILLLEQQRRELLSQEVMSGQQLALQSSTVVGSNPTQGSDFSAAQYSNNPQLMVGNVPVFTAGASGLEPLSSAGLEYLQHQQLGYCGGAEMAQGYQSSYDSHGGSGFGGVAHDPSSATPAIFRRY